MHPKDTHTESEQFTPNEATIPTFAPALSSSRALARFEFEAGKGNEGTKVLMVEWRDDEGDSNWLVSWDGKRTVLPAKDKAGDKLMRIYFLLAPDANIPRIVYISRVGVNSQKMQTNPLPAIFPPELGITTQVQKGVLHTIWAKKRLSALQDEIALEMKNGEGVGLEMALREKKWIEDNFGVISKNTPELQSPMAISPVKSQNRQFLPTLKGLSLTTDVSQINNSNLSGEPSSLLMSPESSDIAAPSFTLFNSSGLVPYTTQTKQKCQPTIQNAEIPKQNFSQSSSFNSLDAVAGGTVSMKQVAELDDGLFALKLSPRSSEMTKSPFSVTI